MKWKDVPEDAREALLEWYNVRNPDKNDLKRLTDLYADGKFAFGNCAECGNPYREGYPDDWGNFQGVSVLERVGEVCGDCYAKALRIMEFAM